MKKTNLKLVSFLAKPVKNTKIGKSRLVVTDYVGDEGGKAAHSVTVKNAVVAAVYRVTSGQYRSAAIYDKRGELVVTIKRTKHGINIHDPKGLT